MQAMHGFAVSLRSRTRLIGCSMAIALVLSALAFASTASAKAPIKETYLALGDSLAFGYSQQLYNEGESSGDPANGFNHGYANVYLKKLAPATNGVKLTNDGCPGESTESMIGPALATALNEDPTMQGFQAANGLPPVKGEDPEALLPRCEYQEAWRFFKTNGKGGPLHHPYEGQYQLANALGEIKGEQEAGTPVTTVTFDIGANDQLHALKKCEKEVGKEFGEYALYQNELKEVEEWNESGGTKGKETAGPPKPASYPKPSQYGNSPEAAVINCYSIQAESMIKQILSNVAGIEFAIRQGAKFTEGGVNYAGQLSFLGGYDPYGVVFRLNEPIGETGKFGTGKELKEGSNGFANLLNTDEKPVVKGFGGCFANPHPRFNPENNMEPTRLQKYTNMANFTVTNGKKYGEPKADGPDIHPTVEGYKQLASILKGHCL